MPIFAWNVPLVSLTFLKRSLDFPILLSSSIYLHWLLRKGLLSLLAILWNSAFKWAYLFFSPVPFTSLLFSAVCKAFSDNHFAFLHFLFWGMVLITASCTMSGTSVHSSSGTLVRSNPLNLSLPLYNHHKVPQLLDTWESLLTSAFPLSHLIHHQGLFLLSFLLLWPHLPLFLLNWTTAAGSFSSQLPLFQFNPFHTPCYNQREILLSPHFYLG